VSKHFISLLTSNVISYVIFKTIAITKLDNKVTGAYSTRVPTLSP
jgi:hypothetical protein